jgi:hypothetical protein
VWWPSASRARTCAASVSRTTYRRCSGPPRRTAGRRPEGPVHVAADRGPQGHDGRGAGVRAASGAPRSSPSPRSSPAIRCSWRSRSSSHRGETPPCSGPGTRWHTTEIRRFAADGSLEPFPRHPQQEGVACVVVTPMRKSGEPRRTSARRCSRRRSGSGRTVHPIRPSPKSRGGADRLLDGRGSPPAI